MPPVTVTCQYCGKEFETRPYYIKRGGGKYCSVKCSDMSHRGKVLPHTYEAVKLAHAARRGASSWNARNHVTLTCRQCGKAYDVVLSRYLTSHYCSRACKDAYQTTIVGAANPRTRRVEATCEYCGTVVQITPFRVAKFRYCCNACKGMASAVELAKKQGATNIEQLMMDELTRRGIPFSPQHRTSKYLIDIALPEYNLAIECDGDYWHSLPKKQRTDQQRDKWLTAHGWRVIRFLGSVIEASPAKCVDAILQEVASLPHP